MDKCPTVELGVQDTQGEKKRKDRASHSPHKVSKSKKVCIPSKSKSRIRLSPLLSSPSPYTIHSPHMHILIKLIGLFLWIHGLTMHTCLVSMYILSPTYELQISKALLE